MGISKEIERIAHKVSDDIRITPAEALVLWREAPLWLLGELAVGRKERVSGTNVFYNRNFHVEPTNVCVFNCEFCSYRRPKGSPEAWDYSLEEIETIVREKSGSKKACKDSSACGQSALDLAAPQCEADGDVQVVPPLGDKQEAAKGDVLSPQATEVHIVGGVHPDHDLHYYVEMIRRVKNIIPTATVKAFTAIELSYMIRKAGLSVTEGLQLLQRAGMEAIPGGGAEIFDETLRAKICPDKGSTAEWFEVHREAHRLGIPTNATMLYGHVETLEHRIDHLDRLRRQQDESTLLHVEQSAFNAFIPLKYRNRNNRMSDIGEVSVVEDLKTLAMSRIYLDNIPHIKAYWVMYGKTITELALAFGADDIDGTIDDSTKIYSMAGGDANPTMTVAEIERMAQNAGYTAVERDTFYNAI